MKFKISKQDLYKHISIAQKAISNKSSIQLLENILFETKGNQLILNSTDLELSIETKIECDVHEEGKVLIKSTLIGNIINKMPQDDIMITAVNDNVNIRSQNSVFDIPAQDASEYPSLPEISEEQSLTLENSEIAKSIRETIFATSQDETRLNLMGVLFEVENQKIRFVGLDGYRMAVRTIPTNADFSIKNIVPKRTFNELSKILDETSTQIIFTTGHIVFINGDTKIYSKLIDKPYIDYKKIINNSYDTKVRVNRNDLINSLERAQLLSTGNQASLSRFRFEDDNINISSNSEYGKLDENVFSNQEGEDLEIAFNTKYVLEGLKAIEEDEVVLHLTSNLSPMNIYPVSDYDDYLYLVLPVRLSQ